MLSVSALTERPRQTEERRLGLAILAVHLVHRLHEIGDRRHRAIDAAFGAAVEQEIGVLVSEAVLRELQRRPRRHRLAASSAVARRVHAEDRLVLLEERDDRIAVTLLRRLSR